MKKTIIGCICCVMAAFIFGMAFVTQKIGGEVMGSYTFNCVRSFIGAAILLPFVLFPIRPKSLILKPTNKKMWKQLWLSGILCGASLAVASCLQQVGLTMGTSAGKGGFLTACYIILVPLFGLFLGKKCPWHVWVCVAVTLGGLYLLCLGDTFAFQLSDLLVLLCSFFYTAQILVIDHYVGKTDPVAMSCIQFLTCGILSAVPMLIFETTADFSGWLASFTVRDAWLALLFAGIMSSGVAYTLQIIGQQTVPPTLASLLISLESTFSVLAGILFLQESMTWREGLGCGLIFLAVMLAQLPIDKWLRRKKNK